MALQDLFGRTYNPRPLSLIKAEEELMAKGSIKRCTGWSVDQHRVLLQHDEQAGYKVLCVEWKSECMMTKGEKTYESLPEALLHFNACLQLWTDGLDDVMLYRLVTARLTGETGVAFDVNWVYGEMTRANGLLEHRVWDGLKLHAITDDRPEAEIAPDGFVGFATNFGVTRGDQLEIFGGATVTLTEDGQKVVAAARQAKPPAEYRWFVNLWKQVRPSGVPRMYRVEGLSTSSAEWTPVADIGRYEDAFKDYATRAGWENRPYHTQEYRLISPEGKVLHTTATICAAG